ncbi:MAG: hypothetical protein ACI8V2_000034 [Candidatus Latescibacterota bacterium]|jgi:hypothetical protein
MRIVYWLESFMRAHVLVLLVFLTVVQGVFAQLLEIKPVSTGGDPVGTWEVNQEPIQVYAAPELLATVSNLQFTGVISGRLILNAQGGYESDYITTSTASLSILGLPLAIDTADTNRSIGSYTIADNILTLTPSGADTVVTVLSYSVNGNTLTVVQDVPLGEFAGLVAGLGGAPLAVFDMNKVNTGFTGPITADFNGNGTVDFPDFISFAQQFGKIPGDIGFDAVFDLNNSGSVDFGDFISFAQQFGLKT